MSKDEPKRIKLKSDFKTFTIDFFKKILTTAVIIIMNCNLMYALETFQPGLFPQNPLNINPSGYFDSALGVTKGTDRDVISMAIGFFMRVFQTIRKFFMDLMGMKIPSVESYVDMRYDNPFTLANIYSWADMNKLVVTVVNTLKSYILGTGNIPINPNMVKVLYNILFYFGTTIFTFSIIPMGAVSVFGMVKGITKDMTTKIPGYGAFYLLGYMILLVLSLVLFPFSPNLYIVGFQIAFIFYHFYVKKFFTQLSLPDGTFKERMSYISKYAKKAHWVIIIMLLLAIYRSAVPNLNDKHIKYVLYGCIGTFISYVLYNIIQFAFKTPAKSPSTK